MNLLYVLLFMFAIALMAGATKKKKKFAPVRASKKAPDLTAPKLALTIREQVMYFRLIEALGNHVVLAQVAFSALLKTPIQADRNRFDRKVADFVVFNKAFEVIAVIELDDNSHKGRELQDAERQALLTRAGYKVIRYDNVPDVQTLHRDFKINPAQIFETAATAQTST